MTEMAEMAEMAEKDMTPREIYSHVDHTLLRPEATWEQVRVLCDEAVKHSTASVCINPGFVKEAADYLAGRIPVCTVIGFPLGATTCESKLFEAKQALANGAAEFDMVINIGALKAGDTAFARKEIEALRAALPGKILKVIVETCLLTNDEKRRMCDIVCAAGADYIKTSTGFSSGGATFADVELLARAAGGRCGVKASGGIKSVADMRRYLEIGARRLGTSSAVQLLG